MDLPSKTVFEVLLNNGVDTLHHANSVITSCQFLRQKSLLSRGSAERSGLKQTSQSSDATDLRYSLWYDVFMDSVDIHRRARKQNHYGPVLFLLDVEKLAATRTGRIWVTKLNPTKWAGVPVEDRWFRSKKELVTGFRRGTFDQMIVFRHSGGALPLADCLDEIILDDPDLKVDGYDLCSTAHGALTLAMSDFGLQVPITKRRCAPTCTCGHYYGSTNADIKDGVVKMFFPYQ